MPVYGGRNPRECAVAKYRHHIRLQIRPCRNPRECAVAKGIGRRDKGSGKVATRANALWQRKKRLWNTPILKSQPARMRCGKEPPNDAVLRRDRVATRANALWQRVSPYCRISGSASQPARMRCGKATFSTMTARLFWSQPARMRCGKVAPLLCPNQKLRKHELRSSFSVSPSVILVVTFYMTAQLVKRFNTCTAKTAASKLSDAAVYSFNK